jgi:hypothetical protein
MEEVEHDDVSMRLLASYLTKDAHRWFMGLPDSHFLSYEYFSKLFKIRWTMKKDNGMLVFRFNQIKKRENEKMSDFDTRFDISYSHIPTDLHPTAVEICLLYVNALLGNFALF